jgi:Ribonuclease G/E
MSERALFLDRGLGETRAVVTFKGQPERLLILRDGDPERLRLGARLRARVRHVEPSLGSAFLDLGEGAEAPQALANTLAIAERCHLQMKFDQILLPRYDVPVGETPETYLEKLATEGLEQVVAEIESFLETPVVAASQGERLRAAWAKGGPWKLPQ